MRYIKIPMERIAVVIGHNGETKRDLENKSGVSLEIDSRMGELAIDDHNVDDPLKVLKLKCDIFLWPQISYLELLLEKHYPLSQ